MNSISKKRTTASKLLEFTMLQHVVDDVDRRYRRGNHPEDSTIAQGQGKILLALTEQDHVSQKELAERLKLTPQSTAEFVRKLEGKGLVTRLKSETDRRVSIVNLTDKGRQVAVEAVNEIPPYLEVLSDEELEQLTHILTKVNDNMYADIENADPTWFNKFHQFLTNRYLHRFHEGETGEK